jgi:hypothetical protein
MFFIAAKLYNCNSEEEFRWIQKKNTLVEIESAFLLYRKILKRKAVL